MHRYELTDEQWARVADYFPANGRRGGQWKDHRMFARTSEDGART